MDSFETRVPHGLPCSTMVYHRFLDVLPPPRGEAIVGSARTGGTQDDFRASIDHFRPGTQSRLREIPMGYLWDIYGISMGYLWIWEVRDSMDMNFMCAVVNLVKTWATCQPWGMVFDPLGLEKNRGPQKDRTVFPGWYRWRFFIILTIVFPFGVARGTSRIPLRWRSPVNSESWFGVLELFIRENTYFFSGLLCSNGWLVVWNMAFNDFSHHIGNVIISTDFQSIIFQRGYIAATTNQP